MDLRQFNEFCTIIEKYDPEYRAFNDHRGNIVIQFTNGDIEEILKQIKEVTPAGMIIDWEYTCDEYEITFYEGRNAEYKKYEQKARIIDAAIQGEFGPVDWFESTLHDDSKYSLTLIGPRIDTENGETCTSISFIARQDGFFWKMHQIKNMIKNCGYNAELITFDGDKDHPYSEGTINMKLDGSEL